MRWSLGTSRRTWACRRWAWNHPRCLSPTSTRRPQPPRLPPTELARRRDLVASTRGPPPQFRVDRLYFRPQGIGEDELMTALYIAGIVAYWALLLVVVKRRSPGEA